MFDDATEQVDPTILRAQNRVGQALRGKWHLDSLLGTGGMAAVYSGTHRNESRAAIKILHPELTVRPEIRRRFLREGRAANRVDHPGVVRVLDEDETEQGEVFLVMELLDGESLEARAARFDGKLPVDEVLSIADQLLGVLVAAHEKNVLHRDLKPENVFLTRAGEVKVLDFGIARLRELSEASHATKTGSSMGTPAYMAPEQARGLWDEVDARADLWAVGATMFNLVTGRPVHGGRTTNEVLVAACTAKVPPIRSVSEDVPECVGDVIDRALAYEKDERWPDAKAMQQAVRLAYEEIHRGAPISEAPSLSVPATVTDETMPSAGVTDVTEQPVVSGKSIARSLADFPKPGVMVGGAVAAVVVIVGGVIVVASGGVPEGPMPSAATPSAPVASAAVDEPEPVQEQDAGVADEEGDAVSIEDLPAAPKERTDPGAVLAPKPKSPKPVAAPPKPAAPSAPAKPFNERKWR